MVGYSGTPLVKKLGIRPGATLFTQSAPDGYAQWLGELPEGARLVTKRPKRVQAAHLFVTSDTELEKALSALRKQLEPDGFVWVSWPKKQSKLPTTVDEHVIRALALPLGFVDIKVCAVSEVWSGLKLVIRVSERGR
jgi:hypothetical protein